MDNGQAIEQEFIQEQFITLLKDDKLGEAFAIYDSVDSDMKDRLFHYICGMLSASLPVIVQLTEMIKKLDE